MIKASDFLQQQIDACKSMEGTGQDSDGLRFSKELMEGIIMLVLEDTQLSEKQAEHLGGMLAGMGHVFCKDAWSMEDRLVLEVATFINSCHR